MGILRPEELSKMFPTPPSLEHNPIASPCGQLDLPLPDYTDLGIVRTKQEIYPNMGSPQEEHIGWCCRFGTEMWLKRCICFRRLELRF
jgi:mediator of RNA polymerase II transcription subunit 13